MLQLYLCCKNGISSNLWPMANSYVTYIFNHMPNSDYIAPAEIFTGTNFLRHKLKDIHMCGCTVYILDPRLQQGRKIQKRQPQSCHRILFRFSKNHSSDVLLIFKLYTGHIFPKFHVIFDDSFRILISLFNE